MLFTDFLDSLSSEELDKFRYANYSDEQDDEDYTEDYHWYESEGEYRRSRNYGQVKSKVNWIREGF